eukprot:8197051-Alexandrium_andersonii.AAC.1
MHGHVAVHTTSPMSMHMHVHTSACANNIRWQAGVAELYAIELGECQALLRGQRGRRRPLSVVSTRDHHANRSHNSAQLANCAAHAKLSGCLLYTSDAADDM